MRVVVALGGNALLKRGEPMTAEKQRAQRADGGAGAGRRRRRARARALARQRSAGRAARAAGGGVHRRRALPARRPRRPDRGDDRLRPRAGAGQRDAARRAARHDPDDGRGRPGRPGVRRTPRSSSGPIYTQGAGRRARQREGLGVQAGRRLLAPGRAVARAASTSSRSGPIRWLLDQGVVVICAGGGGVPTMFRPGGGARP